MESNQDKSLRLVFLKWKKFKAFMTELRADNVLCQFIEDEDEDSVLFKFSSVAMREHCFNEFKSKLICTVKTTMYGFTYLKVR